MRDTVQQFAEHQSYVNDKDHGKAVSVIMSYDIFVNISSGVEQAVVGKRPDAAHYARRR